MLRAEDLLRYILIFFLFFAAVLSCFTQFLELHTSPELLWRDFDQDYLMARATLVGVSPYLPIPELVKHFLPPQYTYVVLSHSSPHPPTSLIWLTPLAFLSHNTANYCWFGISLLSAVLVARGLVTYYFNASQQLLGIFLATLSIMLLLPPTIDDLHWGQFGLLLLALLFFAWRALEAKRDFIAGILIGIAISLKIFLWPLCVFYLIKRKVRVLSGIITGMLPGLLFALTIIGLSGCSFYVTEVLPKALSLWQDHPFNLSLSTLPGRLISHQPITLVAGLFLPSSLEISKTCGLFTAFISVANFAVAGLFFFLILRRAIATDSDSAVSFWGVVTTALLLSPIAWSHYLVLLYPILIVTLRRINWKLEFSDRRALSLPLLLGIILIAPSPIYTRLLHALLANQLIAYSPGVPFDIPIFVSLIFALPTLAIACFVFLFTSGK